MIDIPEYYQDEKYMQSNKIFGTVISGKLSLDFYRNIFVVNISEDYQDEELTLFGLEGSTLEGFC